MKSVFFCIFGWKYKFYNLFFFLFMYITPSLNAINTGNSIFILSEFLGYNVLGSRVKDAIKEGEYVYDVDGAAYLYETIPRHN